MTINSKTLLCVDNDEDWLALLEKFFALEGYNVYTAQTCAQALAKAKEFRPACLIVDLHLGCEDGMSVCSAVKASPELKGMPVILLSGAEAPDSACGCPYDAFVCKALGVSPLLRAVRKLLGAAEPA